MITEHTDRSRHSVCITDGLKRVIGELFTHLADRFKFVSFRGILKPKVAYSGSVSMSLPMSIF